MKDYAVIKLETYNKLLKENTTYENRINSMSVELRKLTKYILDESSHDDEFYKKHDLKELKDLESPNCGMYYHELKMLYMLGIDKDYIKAYIYERKMNVDESLEEVETNE